jgi:hypothetical protein
MITIPSFSKLILLIAIIVGVWYVFRFIGQVDKARQRAAREAAAAGAGRRQQARRAPRGDPRGSVAQVEDTVKCRACGAYVPVRSAKSCGRGECPF